MTGKWKIYARHINLSLDRLTGNLNSRVFCIVLWNKLLPISIAESVVVYVGWRLQHFQLSMCWKLRTWQQLQKLLIHKLPFERKKNSELKYTSLFMCKIFLILATEMLRNFAYKRILPEGMMQCRSDNYMQICWLHRMWLSSILNRITWRWGSNKQLAVNCMKT